MKFSFLPIQWLVGTCLLAGCVSTRIDRFTTFPRLVAGEHLLMMNIHGLSEEDGFTMYGLATNLLKESHTIKYLPDYSYDLLAQGFDMAALKNDYASDSVLAAVARFTECRYILYTDLLFVEHRAQERSNSGRLLFILVDTYAGVTVNEFEVETSISPLSLSEEMDAINFTSPRSALFKAFKKAIKKIRKEVVQA